MLTRALAREPRLVDAPRAELLHSRGVLTARHVLQRPLDELALAADLSVRGAEELLQELSMRLAPPSRSALDMFVASANRPLFLRSGLPLLDRALHSGVRPGGITELAGIAGIGKSQAVMTLAVRCALEYPGESIVYMDAEHNFSAKRLLEIARARLGHRNRRGADASGDISDDPEDDGAAAEVCRRIRVLRVQSLADFVTQLKQLERVMHSMRVRLLVVDSIAALFLKAGDVSMAQREHLMLRITRDLRLLSDTHEAFVVITNRAVIDDGPGGLFTRPLLGETWTHCVTTRVVLERHASHRSMVIVKSPAAGYVVQPYTISRAGLETFDPSEQGWLLPDDHALQLLLDDDVALAALPSIDTLSTLRSTQQSASSSQERLLDALTAPMSEDEQDDADLEGGEKNNGHWALREPFEVVADSQEEHDEDEA